MDLPSLPRRDPHAHKGTFGRALVIGGSRGMAGAVALAGMATSRSGAGLTTLAVPECCLDTVAGFDPNYMTVPLPHDSEGRITFAAQARLNELTSRATSVGVGPGLATSGELKQLVCDLFKSYPGPMVVDADGLNALAASPDSLAEPAGARVLTPHVGEFRRLLVGAKQEPSESLSTSADFEQIAVRFAGQYQIVVVLKGHRTLVTDGTTTYRNTTGNPGMATGGSGDVLTGVITALLGQGVAAMESAMLGVYLHGLAGDLARDARGEVSMTASDIKDHLPEAFMRHSSQ